MGKIYKSTTVPTKPFIGQKPGTSGLRKPVDTFMEGFYTENFIQSSLSGVFGDDCKGKVLVVGGDGRYYNNEALQKIFQICGANKIEKIIVGQHGLFSTPAVSCIIRKYHTDGGFILTASHNPGGPHKDFGIKFNMSNGGPALEHVTDSIYKYSENIKEFHTVTDLQVDISKIGVQRFDIDGHSFTIEVIDSVQDYIEMCEKSFDFSEIKALFQSKDKPFHPLFNAMHGVMGIYVKAILVDIFGVPAQFALNCDPKNDFGGMHPDPNLTYAADMVNVMKTHSIPGCPHYDFGAAFDGDGDRNMILGEDGLFVTPSDSVAFLADNVGNSMPYFDPKRGGTAIKGLARSMPTSGALDRVAEVMKVPFFEVPTGWKFFGNLMDKGTLSICGEESFGTGCDVVREKDGMWACLAWLSVLAHTKLPVSAIQMEHWKKYGRNFFTRYDYENCDSDACHKMIDELEKLITNPDFKAKTVLAGKKVASADNYCYKDPTDGSISAKQGLRIVFEDGSRIIMRLSGTGSTGATVRMYIESYVKDPSQYGKDPQEVLKPLVEEALKLSKLKEYTGRDQPTVIT